MSKKPVTKRVSHGAYVVTDGVRTLKFWFARWRDSQRNFVYEASYECPKTGERMKSYNCYYADMKRDMLYLFSEGR
jgi:hypothetical protein